jgi:hypothetical protein
LQKAILNSRLNDGVWNFTINFQGVSSAPLGDNTRQSLPVATEATTRWRHRQGTAHNQWQARSQTCEKRLASSCLFVCPYEATQPPMGRFSWNFVTEYFSKTCRGN